MVNLDDTSGSGGAAGPDRPRRVVVAVVARGPIAVGIVALGGVSIGIVALGGIAVGVVALGAVSLGLVALGGIAVGWRVLGAIALGGAFAPLLGALLPWTVGRRVRFRDGELGKDARHPHGSDPDHPASGR